MVYSLYYKGSFKNTLNIRNEGKLYGDGTAWYGIYGTVNNNDRSVYTFDIWRVFCYNL